MLGFRDNTTLALTKLRTRRIRLIVTLIVSGLLFSVLIFASLFIRGNLASLTDFTKEGFASRFILSVYLPYEFSDIYDPALVKRAEALQKERIARKTAEAKRLGIPYDSASEPKVTTEGGPDGPKQVGVMTSMPAAKQALLELHPPVDEVAKIKAAARDYNVKDVYAGARLGGADSGPLQLSPIVNGKEVKPSHQYNPGQDPLEGFASNSSTLDNTLLEPFVLKGVDLSASPGGPIPVLAPVDAAEKLLKLSPLPSNATATEKLNRLSELRTKARNLQFSVCYRNDEALDLQNLAKQQAEEAAAAKTTPGYTAPKVQYSESTAPCTPVVTAKDSRSSAEKTFDAKKLEFDTIFGAQAPVTSEIKFRVVGLLPKVDYGAAALDLTGIVSGLLTSTLGPGWYMSHEAAQASPVLGPIIRGNNGGNPIGSQYFAEFADRASQKRFIDERSCQATDDASFKKCTADSKFMTVPFGNPLAALYDNQKDIMNFIWNAVLIIAGLSAVIMMGTVGKIIADSRKETSVFRAVGAKRLDIAQIYLLYAAILSALAFVIALGLGLGIALLLQSLYGPDMSIQAVLAFNSSDINKPYNLIGFHPVDMLQILGFCIAAGLVSALIPLMTNLSRNPIKDMREE